MQEIKMKTLSAGIIFMTEDKDLFMGRVTGSRKPGMMAHRWDIPKGRVESSDLNALEAAKRECSEETGLDETVPVHALRNHLKSELLKRRMSL